MKLSDQESRILYHAEMRARASLSEIAKLAGCRETTARYHLQRLKERGVLLSQRAYINFFRLRCTNYAIYFSLRAEDPKKRADVLSALSAAPQIWWLAEVGGDYQFAASITATDVSEVSLFLDGLTERFGNVFFEKTISIRTSQHMFSRKYIAPKKSPINAFHLGVEGGPLKLDETDYRVLEAIAFNDTDSRVKLSERVEIPFSTFERRLKRLEQVGIVVGYFYRMDVSKLGIQQFRLLITTGTMYPKLRSELEGYAFDHTNIRKFIGCLGSWDCEMEVNVHDISVVSSITSQLYHRFQSDIKSIKVIPLIRQMSAAPFALPRLLEVESIAEKLRGVRLQESQR